MSSSKHLHADTNFTSNCVVHRFSNKFRFPTRLNQHPSQPRIQMTHLQRILAPRSPAEAPNARRHLFKDVGAVDERVADDESFTAPGLIQDDMSIPTGSPPQPQTKRG
ncbi:hypothetical protein BDA96_02G452100 [Sorghum bicolor]|uniref:Uncharacterized protein n=1 Tax=Sorghum bicolor TaxID=4558 RepID=A0A921RVK1_SORBI|nr:hypothetical protein BDA96_02G452100 [Sorghum bicolor]